VDIHLYTHIPSGAGLGGGSSDAAFMLKLLNKRFELGLTTEKLEEYAAALGADCAFFINNMPTYAEGIGNLFSPITLSLKDYQILLVKPDIFVSTREAFSLIKPHKPEYSLKETIALPVSEWKERLVNDFEASVFPQYPAIGEIKDELYQKGAIYAAMSGSGSSVFGLFAPGTPLPEADFGKESFVFKGKMI
ncbi:4-(cytidine 5'-diphospho)-2-C-methyl-D-erythritol kinase, partial [Bacteroides salyersiae]|uniref:4-(cytidine 5'-diphospho)-2-C-methyl-D-erythritol kinase n=1 Tax=Bacteroides salyersiae TaxID=291644 RepID=UPI00125D3014